MDGSDEVHPESNGPPQVLYTIDELAAAAGLPTRTVRHYQSQGALPPPQRQGRIALYQQEHLQRLRLIADLQDRGLRLSAIRDALRQLEKGEMSLEDWLGVGEHLRRPWSQDAPTVLSKAELSSRLGERPGLIAALVEARLVRRQRGLPPSYLVPSPGLLDIALKLEEAGVDVATGAGAAGLIRKQMRRAADELVGYLLDRTGQGFAGSGSADDVAQALEALRRLGVGAVKLVFAQEMERALQAAAEQGRASPLRVLGERRERVRKDAET